MTSTDLVTRDFGFMLNRVRLHRAWVQPISVTPDDDGFGLYDISIVDGRVAAITPAAADLRRAENDMGGRIATPCFTDCHTHLDKGHIWPRRPNPDGTFQGALGAVREDRLSSWSAQDVEARMQFGLECAYAYGTRAIRTHLDSLVPQDSISWPIFEDMRARWSDRITLQASSLVPIDDVRDVKQFGALATRVAQAGGTLGAVAFMVEDLDELLDTMMRLASEHGLDLDFHADETDDPDADALDHIARAVVRNRFEGRVLVGHCCSLARQSDDAALATLDRVAEAGLSIVSLPLCNLYLQDRRTDQATPRWRGVTLVHEMAARGINVAIASDNTRDPFYAYGDLDMLEVYRTGTRVGHFDHPVGDWPRTVFANPVAAMGLDEVHGRIAVGEPADLIVFEGRSWTELLSRPEANRIVIRNGSVIDRQVPPYARLDHLME